MTLVDRKQYLKTLIGSAAVAVLFFYLARTGGCAGEPNFERFHGEVMGTTYNVTVVYPDQTPPLPGLDTKIQEALDAVDADLSTYKADSSLSELNKHTTNEPFKVTRATAFVLRAALQISRETDGAFDVTVGPLVNAWGFGPENAQAVPDDDELSKLRENVGYQMLSVADDSGEVSKSKSGIYCDLSAIAKGYGVDQTAEALEAEGVTNYMVEVGGEIRCQGVNPDGVPWRIAIERPVLGPERQIQRVVALENMALATSGDYRNFIVDEDGHRRSHTIDPRTGRPIEHNLASVSVFHPSCMYADAYATALTVLGPEEGLTFANEQGLAVLFLVRNEDGTFTEQPSEAFRPYLK